jgi:hypothetical protein
VADNRQTNENGDVYRMREVRRGEFAPEVAIADSSIPGSGLFFSTDNEMMVAPRTSVLSIDTEGSTLPVAWVAAHVGSGAATQGQGELRLRTGATPDSRARVTSSRVVRRRAGATQWYISVWRAPVLPSAGTVIRWGMYDDNNGFFFELRPDGLYCGTRKAGVDTVVAPADQNGPLLAGEIDLTRFNQFNLFYGGLSCRWQVNGRVLHSIGAGVPTSALTESLNLPMRAEVVNSGGSTADVSLYGRGVSFHRVSPSEVIPSYRFINTAATTVVAEGAATLRRIIFSPNGAGGILTVYDNTAASGAIVTALVLPASGPVQSVDYGLEVENGLTVVTTINSNVTVVFD